MNTQDKMERVKEIVAREIGDDCYLSLVIFEPTDDDSYLWSYNHVHNFDRDAVSNTLRAIADKLDDEEDEDEFNLN